MNTKTNFNIWEKLINIQIILNIIIAIGTLFTNSHKFIDAIAICGLIYFFMVSFNKILPKLTTINRGLAVIFLPIIFTHYLNVLTLNLLHTFSHQQTFFLTSYLILLLIYLLPTAITYYGAIQNNWCRILAIIFLMIILLASINMHISTNYEFLTNLLRVKLIPSLALMIMVPFLLKKWHFRLRAVFKPQWHSIWQLIPMLLLILFTAWLTFFNSFVYLAPTPDQLIGNWDLSIIVPTKFAILKSLGAALMEETERYLILVLLLFALRKSKFQVNVAILLSALQFSLLHLYNLTNSEAKLSTTLIQLGYTFGYGCFLAVLYLYSGQIWLPMLSHFTLDLVSYSVSGGEGFLSLYGNIEIIGGLLVAAVTLIAALLMIFGKQEKIMKLNSQKIIEQLA